MDYSSSLHDADNPAGVSPWGSSPVPSPQHNRSSFSPSMGDTPSSPTPFSPNRIRGDSYISDSGMMGSGGLERHDSVGENTRTDRRTEEFRPEAVQSVQSESMQQQVDEESQSQFLSQQPAQEGQRGQGTGRQNTRAAPQYKLLAKITGLERTGRKDPILRFDVHV
jgi:hypothetical protein